MSKLFKYKGYEGTAEIDPEGDVCFGKILFIDDLVTYEADSPKQLRSEFEAAVDDYLETCKQLKREPKKPFSGQFNVRVNPEQHKLATLRAHIDGVALNTIVGRALDAYLSKASTSTVVPRESITQETASNTMVVELRDPRFQKALRQKRFVVVNSAQSGTGDTGIGESLHRYQANLTFTPQIDVTPQETRRDH